MDTPTKRAEPQPPDGGALWRGWVLAATVGELVGFGLATLAGMLVGSATEGIAGPAGVLAWIGVVALAGAVEGTALGSAQWWVLRRYLPPMTWRRWVGSTVASGIGAWGLGMGLGQNLDLNSWSLPLLVVGGLVFVVGLGAILGLGQAWALRPYIVGAAWWVPANALAWTIGLLIAFGGTALIPDWTNLPVVALLGGATGLLMGATTAAITGLVLVRLPAQPGESVPLTLPLPTSIKVQ
jgi:hypothetical protein